MTDNSDADVTVLQDLVLRLQREKDEQAAELGRYRDRALDLFLLIQRWRANSKPRSGNGVISEDGAYLEGHKHGFRDCADELDKLVSK